MFDLEWLDIKLFYLLNVDMQNGIFDVLMPWVTNRNNWWPVVTVFAVYILAFGQKRDRVALLAIGIAVGLSDFTASSIIKPLVGRIRPCHLLDAVNLLVSCGKSYSFPSSHAANMFALATAGSYYFRRATIPLFILAVTAGYSRIYVGVHYPFDVLGGAVLGGAIGAGVVWIERKIAARHAV